MASRILGMGDVLTLIDKAQQAFDEKQAEELERKIRQQSFTLDDYLEQMKQMKKQDFEPSMHQNQVRFHSHLSHKLFELG